ncbi:MULTISPECIES: hypothetical protein [Halomonadaceae]|uniref:Uncharacterized protein n=1 Tax=Billgrantia aerodenitrificans TaxID=2733483 RepID=A0ABS9ASY8_9GAMM|nr:MULTISPECIES: hypothetical protein [Halomonas]MCE8024854.1 hypothetical protein [Halomonas aerodenitrificans]
MLYSDYVERNFMLLTGVEPRKGDVERTSEVLARVLGAIDYSCCSVAGEDAEEAGDFDRLIEESKVHGGRNE